MLKRLSKRLGLDKAAHFLVRKHPKWSIAALVIVFVLIIILGYLFKWDWTGLNAHVGPNIQQYQPTKTLWDWLSVLCIPVAIAFGSLWFTTQQSKTQNAENIDNQHEAALQGYINKISDLMQQYKLSKKSNANKAVRTIARAQTLTVLASLDSKRKGDVLQFLHESDLIQKEKPIISLYGANLAKAHLYGAILDFANLSFANLSGANLEFAYLRDANLEFANLSNVVLYGADLCGADLSGTNLSGANLSGADLNHANFNWAKCIPFSLNSADLSHVYRFYADDDLVRAKLNVVLTDTDLISAHNLTPKQLAQARSLKGTIMPDGSSIENPGDPDSFASKVLALWKQQGR